jgi:hypothetical protein
MPRVKKVVEPVLIEPVVDIEDTETETKVISDKEKERIAKVRQKHCDDARREYEEARAQMDALVHRDQEEARAQLGLLPLEPPKLKRSRTKKATTPEEPVVEPAVEVSSGKKENMWVAHVQKVRSANDGMSYKEAMKLAKETYYK